MMLETARYVAKLNPDMLKIHMLHVIKSSQLVSYIITIHSTSQ